MKRTSLPIAVVAVLALIVGFALASGADTRDDVAHQPGAGQDEERAGTAATATPAPARRAPAPWGTGSTGLFCDNSIDAGTSGACELEAQAQGLLVCANGNTPTNVNCSLPQGNCPNGTPCKCSFHCGSLSEY